MTLDCTQLKPGDKVRLRNDEIRTVTENDGSAVPIGLGDDHWNYADGLYYSDGSESPRDIVEILPPEQATVPAMAQSICHRAITLTHDTLGYEHPDVIDCNGKRYVPADSPSLFTGRPFSLITRPDEGLVAIRYDDRLFTPADAWPEPIKDRPPAKEDADRKGLVRRFDSDGDWTCADWNCPTVQQQPYGWARMEHWKPKPTPAYAREEVLHILRDSKSIAAISMAHAQDDPDLLNSIIAHLEAQP